MDKTLICLLFLAQIGLFVGVFGKINCMDPYISLEDSCVCRLKNQSTSRKDSCPSSTCVHGTVTFNRSESLLKCLCDENYEGLRCDLIYCKYGHRINADACQCEEGFQGKNCKEMVCQNEGTSVIENGWTKCKCQDGFAGKRCESKVPKCGEHGKVVWVETSDFVKEKLLRVDPSKKLMCHCDPGYGGELCLVKRTCKNGKLMDTGCVCDHRWTGDYCDIPVCLHGTMVGEGCLCEFGWGGRFCETCLWGEKAGDLCVQYAYSTPAKDEVRSGGGPHFKMSWTAFFLILIVCSIIFLGVGCWFHPRKHLGVCFPSLREYNTPPEQNSLTNPEGAVNARVVVVQDSGSRQIVVNVPLRDKNENSMPRSKTSPPSNSKNSTSSSEKSCNSTARRHSTGSRPPSYSQLAQEDPDAGTTFRRPDEILPTYRVATSYREAMRRAESDGLIINFIDEAV